MDLYLVRHGQTDGNVAKRHQHPSIELNENGKQQARKVAKILRHIKPTHLITSTNVRAVETARQIGLVTDLIPETYPAFEELKRPQFLIGERFHSKVTIKYIWGWFLGLKGAPMHDGESYTDFLSRLEQARDHLTKLPKDSRVVVVSHAVFINFFLEHMNRPERMGFLRAAIRFFKILHIRNTSVTVVEYHPTAKKQWHILGHF